MYVFVIAKNVTIMSIEEMEKNEFPSYKYVCALSHSIIVDLPREFSKHVRKKTTCLYDIDDFTKFLPIRKTRIFEGRRK